MQNATLRPPGGSYIFKTQLPVLLRFTVESTLPSVKFSDYITKLYYL